MYYIFLDKKDARRKTKAKATKESEDRFKNVQKRKRAAARRKRSKYKIADSKYMKIASIFSLLVYVII